MGSYKTLLNELSNDDSLRQLTEEEIRKLRKTYLDAFLDLQKFCRDHDLTVMLIGGSSIGAVRHQGFIPWDDDLDVAMTRDDYEKLKTVFDKEMGDRYILAAPNHHGTARNRFPQILIKDTLLVEAGEDPEDRMNKIKIDIFLIENIPENSVIRKIKGVWCSLLMFMGSYAETYLKNNKAFENYMCKTEAGRKEYKRRIRLGRCFSFFSFEKWMDIIDRSYQYPKRTSLMGIPSGRGHYFGEIRPAETFVPTSKGTFEGLEIDLPGNADDYISNLYGANYMELPPVEKRERHFVFDIKFKDGE